MTEAAFYYSALAVFVLAAIVSSLIASGHLRPLRRLTERIEPVHSAQIVTPEQKEESVLSPEILSRWRVAIDARPMIGHLDGGEYRVYGIGQYLRNLVEEIATQDKSTQYVLWSSSLKGSRPDWVPRFYWLPTTTFGLFTLSFRTRWSIGPPCTFS